MVQTAWPCLGLAIERLWLALGGLFLATFPCRLLFPAFMACYFFQLKQVGISREI